ncbi:hypothetical protein DFA_10963 [Cavenderia fasciculata]|uniref:Uncharacterized protein n=1 Tax=Cavenderia fasciculata TaxID=261658 RepID=F4QBW7_CACFS|nr:uncharacterized protein DFA_10963 [Cavenderia fasciculata]EGG14705.1 hypothetical protein DFA_10963 [Cavenderia fasciculata]|eukprot:XP_004351213.1 hypothetical protein DFA_10963 [Cavenderia fasciculata]
MSLPADTPLWSIHSIQERRTKYVYIPPPPTELPSLVKRDQTKVRSGGFVLIDDNGLASGGWYDIKSMNYTKGLETGNSIGNPFVILRFEDGNLKLYDRQTNQVIWTNPTTDDRRLQTTTTTTTTTTPVEGQKYIYRSGPNCASNTKNARAKTFCLQHCLFIQDNNKKKQCQEDSSSWTSHWAPETHENVIYIALAPNYPEILLLDSQGAIQWSSGTHTFNFFKDLNK